MTETQKILSSRPARPSFTHRAQRWGALAFALSGALFVVYPAVRPFSNEKGLQGATAFASTRWVVAHSAAMVGFILLGLGFFALREKLRLTRGERLSSMALVTGWAATGLALPYYGAECFALDALGKEALKRQDGTLISMASSVRFGPGVVFIVTGLLGLAVAAVLFAVAIGRSGWLPRWAGAPLVIAMVLYLPQFAANQPVRVMHGALMALGCSVLGVWMLVQPHRLQADLRRERPSGQVAVQVASGARGSR